jgi:hypothetical protein
MRLRILSDDEIEALYVRPRFTHEERNEYFALSPTERTATEQLRFVNAKIYFILPLGYFKARRMFFVFNPQEASEELGFIRERYFPDVRGLERSHFRGPVGAGCCGFSSDVGWVFRVAGSTLYPGDSQGTLAPGLGRPRKGIVAGGPPTGRVDSPRNGRRNSGRFYDPR